MRLLPTLAFLIGAVSLTASAGTLYSSFGPGYHDYDGWAIMQTSMFTRTAAMGFTVASASMLDRIDLAYFSGEAATLTFTLYSSSAMDVVSAVRSWSTGVAEQSTQILTLQAGSTPTLLSAGTTYWLLATTSNGSGAWLYGSPSVSGPVYTSDGSSSGTFDGPQGALQVQGAAATPEPAVPLLLLSGLGLLGALRLRRRA